MKKILCLLTAAALGLGACSAERVSNFPSYKLTVTQGNELDAQVLAHLQPGLNKVQVRALLGTPLLQDPFHRNRWDYVFVITRNGVVKENRTLTLYFNDDDQLVKYEGNALESAAPSTDTTNHTASGS